MKILSVSELVIPDVYVIRYARFHDDRGYFTESYQMLEFATHEQLQPLFAEKTFVQTNESYSKAGTIRGLHMQWSPPQGKLIRTVWGRMVDMILDIRPNSETFGKAIMYEMPADPSASYGELIWVPFGMAHGNFYNDESKIEYMVDSPWGGAEGEGSISPMSEDIDWSMCDVKLKKEFDHLCQSEKLLINDKDKNGMSLEAWKDSDTAHKYF